MRVHLLSVLAFVVVSFAVQALSHFVINAQHFASVGFLRAEPIIALGLLVMVVQGAIMSLALAAWRAIPRPIDGVAVSGAFGAFLVAYIALVEPSKYVVPSVAGWFAVELAAGAVQFAVFGLLLGLIHARLSPG